MAEEILQTALKSVFSIVLLFILTRIMGKKQISQLTFFDYVSGISIGSIAAAFAVDDSVGYLKGITGLIVYALFPVLLSAVSLKSYRGRKFLDGSPTVLIRNGKIVESGLKRSRMNINDLLEECRLKNAFNLADVESAVLETNGKLSVQMKAPCRPLTPRDMSIPVAPQGLMTKLIVDGKVLKTQLVSVGKDEAWLEEQLLGQGISHPSEVLLAVLASTGVLHVFPKSDPFPSAPPL
ncbi:DUF421 domain-containing protein [Papillibacter cinnamivorans]|uniref:Uncharacterized membrane protein YcaP, DUF421 family n=1 Tax=Papillibacter cinnamivorans DSM 12816 TaxID=1122930 RepID=A0A1W1ZHP7_9FIRM|nr:DUF421 domain-containing protein [Papillibacter cinnamivorans]SMC48065.1 Uncharacterized membrane protein YcaP, DUF421 family [Papillibacter cinnamivorans DSM 12816]